MSEKEIIEGTAGAVAKHLPKTTKAADNVLSSIVDIFDIILTPFQVLKVYKDIKMAEFRKNLKEKTDKIPPEFRKEELDLNIVGPTLEALKYTFLEDDLREMFENLLASSIDKREDVFPSFIDIVRQLSSDEAKLLKYLSKNGNDYPIVDLKYVSDDNTGYLVIVHYFTDIGYGILEKPELISAYLNDLSRFGLIEIQIGTYLVDDSLYKSLEDHSVIQDAKKETVMDEPGKFEIEKHKFSVTEYGSSFIKSCVIEKWYRSD